MSRRRRSNGRGREPDEPRSASPGTVNRLAHLGPAGSRGERYVFVGGPPRSGTTLLQNVLDSHPDVCGAPELYHLKDVIALRGKLHRSLDRGWIREFCSRESADDLLATFIEGLLRPVHEKYGRDLLSEKTPANVLVFTDLMELFPGARFLFMVRDPRAVVASLLRVGQRARRKGWHTPPFTRSLSAAVDHVRDCLDAGFRAVRAGGGRVHVVVYERLVRDPEAETRRLCEFLGIPWSERMLHPGRRRHPGEADIVNDVWYAPGEYYRDPDPAEIDRWRTALGAGQQAAVVAAFRDHEGLAGLGYRVTLEHLPLPRRLLGRAAAVGPRATRSLWRRARSARRRVAT